MKFIKLYLMLVLICFSCSVKKTATVNSHCYRNSYGFLEDNLPLDICIEKNKVIYNLFDKFDFNGDGLLDIALEIGDNSLINGMQTELVIYKKNFDNTYTKFRSLNNVYPIWFANYEPTIKLKNEELNTIKQHYKMGNPLNELEVLDNKIVLNLNADVGYKYSLMFTYDANINDWLLSDYIMFDIFNDTKKTYQSNKYNTSIKEFSYFNFIDGLY